MVRAAPLLSRRRTACARFSSSLRVVAAVSAVLRLAGVAQASKHVLPSVNTTGFTCEVPANAPRQALKEIAERNCHKVDLAYNETFKKLRSSGVVSDQQWSVWAERYTGALQLCTLSTKMMHSNEINLAALFAINAWGYKVMSGKECCALNSPPYCSDRLMSISTVAIMAVVFVVFFLFAGAAIGSCYIPSAYALATEDSLDDAKPPVQDKKQLGAKELKSARQKLEAELQESWEKRSCLRTLPCTKEFSHAVASLFGALHDRFDFQADNVRNQHEHFISMMRSMCAMKADRYIADGEVVNENTLLRDALEDLWTEMLEGFRLWRRRLYSECPEAGEGIEVSSDESDCEPGTAALGGAQWAPIQNESEELSKQLAELVTFLLVWGEAGNVRFMPEVLYFITEQTLVADDAKSCGALYGDAPRWTPEAGTPYRSGLFLSKVIRPIYNVVFSEWYDHVEGTGDKKDKKVLREGYDNFLPADAANYDDWDELFWDPPRMIDRLVLRNGERLYDLPPGQRFAALHRLDWGRSLSQAKTHREVHSLWGVFAATHRIVLVHLLMFFLGAVMMADRPPTSLLNEVPLGGHAFIVRLAAVGLIGPLHAAAWVFSRWETAGFARRRRDRGFKCVVLTVLKFIVLATPVVTFAVVRQAEVELTRRSGVAQNTGDVLDHGGSLCQALIVHGVASLVTIFYLLFCSSRTSDKLFKTTHVPLRLRAIRNIFWFCVLLAKFTMWLFVFREVFTAFRLLDISLIGQETYSDISTQYLTSAWCAHLLLWMMVWSLTLLLFIGDTQLWFTLGCAILGTLSYMVQRRCRVVQFVAEDAVAKIPERFSRKVLTYAPVGLEARSDKSYVAEKMTGDSLEDDSGSHFSAHFPAIWDRIVEYMRYEDKIDNQVRGDLCFHADVAGNPVYWTSLSNAIHNVDHANSANAEGEMSPLTAIASNAHFPSGRRKTVNLPSIFREKTACEAFFQDLNPATFGPTNNEVQWRLKALGRGLGLPMPRPYRAPYIPGLTVLIPHYGEAILMKKDEVYKDTEYVPLIDWVKTKYDDEFRNFTSRMQGLDKMEWPAAGSHWARYSDEQWEKICAWTSMRMQTLWRTVAGMWQYLPALQVHYEVQGDQHGALGAPDVWDAADCFTLIVSMQMYHFFDRSQLEHTNKMLAKFPRCVKIAYISCEDKNETADVDRIHQGQERRYFSCLIDSTCERSSVPGRLIPKLRIELPGFPILGDGKGDNQNHAIPFMRGLFSQCIDANQGAYFEQMLLLPCALGEFRTRWKGDSHSKRIVGFPEHITSDIGSIGDFAASAELAFGTLLQRTYAVLGARMHYGHPDLMSKIWMIQQGGVSKATKTLNLSEDIFAGMDFTLRGENRKIRHCEYFHLAKGRDLGFNAVLGFFSKLSSGAGEQILSRQMFRLHQLFHLPECFTFFYAHVGYYFTQFFVSASMPFLVVTWLLLLVTDCHSRFAAFEACKEIEADMSGYRAAEVMANMLSVWFSILLLFFLLITNLPLFLEVWMENRFITAFIRFVKQMMTLSPLLFVFQAKTIGYYVMNELRYGGATYVATGRGLPTERRPFVGRPAKFGFKLEQVGGLYLEYAHIAYYDGIKLLGSAALVLYIGGIWKAGEAGSHLFFLIFSICITIVSWLYAPFIFNPYQFEWKYYVEDLRAWASFFLEDGGTLWVKWYNANHLKPRKGVRHSIIDVSFFVRSFFVLVWFTAVNMKLHIYFAMFDQSQSKRFEYAIMLLPPFALSATFCTIVAPLERLVGCSRMRLREVKRHIQLRRSDTATESSSEDDFDNGELQFDLEDQPPVAHEAAQDRTVVAKRYDEEPEDNACGCSCRGTPLAFISVVVVLLDIAEAFLALLPLISIGWTNAVAAGAVLKFTIMGMTLWIGEGIIKSLLFDGAACFNLPLKTWVYTHRMARDLVTSSFILFTLGIFVFLNSINEFCLPGCSIHQLLIYRDPGHLKRTEALVVDADKRYLPRQPDEDPRSFTGPAQQSMPNGGTVRSQKGSSRAR